MGKPGAKKKNKSGNYTDGLRQKDLKLTVIFAPVSRSELFDIYNPLEYPTVNREMRIITRQVDASSAYVSETQDKVIYINCGSAQCFIKGDGDSPLIVTPDSLKDKLQRAIQLIHELLDYYNGYKGTVFTTFCCFQPLEGVMMALQSILKCSVYSPSSDGGSSSMDVPGELKSAFDIYEEWTFQGVHTSVYKAEYKYEVYNNKSETENLQEENERLINSIEDEKAWQKFREYQDATGTFKTSKRFGLEDFVKYHPEYSKQLSELDKNNKRLKEIEADNKKKAEEWSHKSKAERMGVVKRDINKHYDKKVAELEKKNAPFIAELKTKRRLLGYQQNGTSQFHPDEAENTYQAYDLGVDLHGETHSRDTIEYEGEYYTEEQLTKMINALETQKTAVEEQRKKAWREARDKVHQQYYMETLEASLSIIALASIILTPLVLVDIIVVIGKMCTIDGYAKDWHNWLALGLDFFALIPFVGTLTKASRFGRVTQAAVAETIVNDVTRQGKAMISNSLAAAAEHGAKAERIATEINNTKKVINGFEATEAAERATANGLKQEASSMTRGFMDGAKQGDIVAQQVNNEIKAGNLMSQALEHEAKAEAARVAKEAAQKAANPKLTNLKNSLLEPNQALGGAMSDIGGGVGEVAQGLPIISIKGYVDDIRLTIKNWSNMSKGARRDTVGNLIIQGINHGGNVNTAYGAFSVLGADNNAYTVQCNGDDCIIVARN